MDQLAKELHKPVIRKFQRRRVIVKSLDEIWGIDLVDMQEWAKLNDGYKYILTIIDCFSRYAWAIPLKDKSASSVTEAFTKLFKHGRIPTKLWNDEGSEFYNSSLSKLLSKHNITMYSTYGDHKSAVVERFNRTLKEKMWQQFTAKNTRKWIDMLPELIRSYNDTKHRTIKMTPNDASKKKNGDEVLINNENQTPIKKVKAKLSIGDFVRIARIKGVFEKGYIANWSQEIFKVVKVLDTAPVTYKIEEYDGTPIDGSFYEQELQKTKNEGTYLVESVLETKTVKGKKLI